jgi:hypothetical protein
MPLRIADEEQRRNPRSCALRPRTLAHRSDLGRPPLVVYSARRSVTRESDMSMPRWTLALALFLIVLGVGSYFLTGMQSVTALIPAFLGLLLIGCVLWARREGSRRNAMHAATALALLGFGGTISGVLKIFQVFAGETVERHEAALAQAIVAIACAIYLWISARSFLRARRARAAAENDSQ